MNTASLRAAYVALLALFVWSCAHNDEIRAQTVARGAHATADELELSAHPGAAAAALAPALETIETSCQSQYCLRVETDIAARIAENHIAAGQLDQAQRYAERAEQISSALRDTWRIRALIVLGRVHEQNGAAARASESYEEAQILASSLLQQR